MYSVAALALVAAAVFSGIDFGVLGVLVPGYAAHSVMPLGTHGDHKPLKGRHETLAYVLAALGGAAAVAVVRPPAPPAPPVLGALMPGVPSTVFVRVVSFLLPGSGIAPSRGILARQSVHSPGRAAGRRFVRVWSGLVCSVPVKEGRWPNGWFIDAVIERVSAGRCAPSSWGRSS
ncbi:hypothetical protein ACFWFH_25015 [Streptomyces coelicoflavus]|uniref:hypothetical protein n=1 Tax=Streptomyces coelicoflavus TaxID=285562 RepID=UPI00344D1AEF